MNLLVALDALLAERGVTGAARRVHVTPSAMSHSLAELRELFDDPLLVRAGRGMALTPRAEALRRPLHRVLLDAKRWCAIGAGFDPRHREAELRHRGARLPERAPAARR